MPAWIPDFVDVVPEVKPLLTPPSVVQVLQRFKADITEMKIAAVDYYEYLQVSTVELSPSMPPRGHIDGGALASTTNRKEYLWSYHQYTDEERSQTMRLKVADDTVHIPTGISYLKVPCSRSGKCKFVRTYYTPEIPATILSPDAMGRELDCQGYQTYSDFRQGYATLDLTNCKSQADPFHFQLRLIRGLLFTDYMIAPTEAKRVSPHLPDGTRPVVMFSNRTSCVL